MSAAAWVGLPVALAAVALHPRWRGGWRERLGLAVAPVEPGALWVHAASLGELAAAEGLISAVHGPVLLSTETDTGLRRAVAIAARRPRTAASPLPIDHPWALAPLLAEARPRGLVLLEGAWWPAAIAAARAAGVKVIRANTRPPRARWLAGRRTHDADVFLARDPASAAALGIRSAWTGDLKLLRPIPPSPLRWAGPFWAAASTRPADEAAVLAVRRDEPLLLAPRHLDRVEPLRAALAGRRVALASELGDGVVPPEVEVVVLDRLGELAGALRGATVVFVGGTFDPAVGGHSPAEALALGLPIAAGPHRGAHPHLFAGCAVADAPAALPAALRAARKPAVEVPDRYALERLVAGFDRPAAETAPRPWARPLAGPVGLAATARGLVRRLRATSDRVPRCVVASDNPRGSGKTATARWWAEALRARGARVGIAVRGYARESRRLTWSWERSDAAGLGDEGAWLARLGFTVVAGDLASAARALSSECDVVVVDDGGAAALAGRVLRVVDARYPSARGPLPAGERRPGRLGEPCGLVVHHVGPGFPAPPAAVPTRVARRAFGAWRRGGREDRLPDGPLLVFAGLGRPLDALGDLADRPGVELVPLADHQAVTPALAAALRARAAGRPLVCTPKDHVRLPPDLAEEVWWRDAWITLDDPPPAWFP